MGVGAAGEVKDLAKNYEMKSSEVHHPDLVLLQE